jgi:hypothetical protein
MRRLPRAELAFADHPLVPVHLVFNSVVRRIAFAEKKANYLEAAFSRMLDAPLWKEFHCLTEMVFVL